MRTIPRMLLSRMPGVSLASLTYIAGTGGMIISFMFLASGHYLDVTAGAAGFIAGSVLVAAGVVSIHLRRLAALEPEPSSVTEGAAIVEPPLDVARWVEHFHSNQQNRREPNWAAPITLPAAVVGPLVRSLEQFQLGDGGGPAYLIARDRERFLSQDEGVRKLVGLWFAEEREHARLLGEAVARFGGKLIQSHWSFTAFCMTRRWFGVRFELTVLLLTEIVSTVYYRLLLRHGKDSALRSMCRLIMRDEIGHVAFHRDRLSRRARSSSTAFGRIWESCFCVLGLSAATMLWVNHAPGLRAVGATRSEFYKAVWRELSIFVAKLRADLTVRETDQFEGSLQPALRNS